MTDTTDMTAPHDRPVGEPIPGCDPGPAYARYWRGWHTFRGRASRSEYWWSTLLVGLVSIGLATLASIIDQLLGTGLSDAVPGAWGAVTLLPSMACATRRVRDAIGRGWPAPLLIVAGNIAGAILIVGLAATPMAGTPTTVGAIGLALSLGALIGLECLPSRKGTTYKGKEQG